MAAQSTQLTDSLPDHSTMLPFSLAQQAADTEIIMPPDETANQLQSAAANRFITTYREPGIKIVPREIFRSQTGHEMVLIALGLSILIFAYIRISRRSFFKNLQQAIFSRPIFRQLLRDGALFGAGSRSLVSMANLITFTALSFSLLHYYQLEIPWLTNGRFMMFAKLGLLILAFFWLKTLIIRLTAFIFKTGTLAREYRANTFFFNTIAAVVLIPLLFFSVLDKGANLLLIAFSAVFLLFIFRIIRALLISLDVQKYSLYQIFLYLCALEILPILVIIKAIMISVA